MTTAEKNTSKEMSMRFQLSEEAFCALAKQEIPQISPPPDFRLGSIQRTMKFTKFYTEQPERKRTELQKLVGRNKSRLFMKRIRYSEEFLKKEGDMIKARRKIKNTKTRKIVGINNKEVNLKRGLSSFRNDSKKHLPESRDSKKPRLHTPPAYRRQFSHTTFLLPDNPDETLGTTTRTIRTIYPGVAAPPGLQEEIKNTIGPVRPTAVLYHHCNVTRDECLTAYHTGFLCGRTSYQVYSTFDDYCALDYANCRDGFDFWKPAHTGPCFKIEPYSEYVHYPYQDDYFLDRDIVIEDIF